MEEQYIRIREAAELLGVHAMTVGRWVKAGKLPGAWVGDILYVQLEAVHEHLERARLMPGALAHLVEYKAGKPGP